jgi:NAD(P)-dependent dehydrogenase (short-subunit alcohol dehydrogenase family)
MAFEKFDLTGKTALITGAAGLLGLQHAYALLESGASVILTDIKIDQLLIAKSKLDKTFEPSKIFSEVMDVSNFDEVTDLSHNLLLKNLTVDILVNNAAIDPKVKTDNSALEVSRFENFSLDQWNKEISVGLTGAFICSQVFGSLMAKSVKNGVILNIASDLSIISPDQRLYAKPELSFELQPVKPITYSVIKSGLLGLTRYLSTYWVNSGIRCNALSPGGVINGQSDEFVKRISSLIPMGRMANYDEYRSAVQFLCSDASSYMNGQNVVLDGGRSVW